jgi:hypothetical protein
VGEKACGGQLVKNRRAAEAWSADSSRLLLSCQDTAGAAVRLDHMCPWSVMQRWTLHLHTCHALSFDGCHPCAGDSLDLHVPWSSTALSHGLTPVFHIPPLSCFTGGKTEDFWAAAKLLHRAKRTVKVPTYLVPATQKVGG